MPKNNKAIAGNELTSSTTSSLENCSNCNCGCGCGDKKKKKEPKNQLI